MELRVGCESSISEQKQECPFSSLALFREVETLLKSCVVVSWRLSRGGGLQTDDREEGGEVYGPTYL